MTFATKYSGITYLPYPYLNLNPKKKEKYLDNYFNLITHLRINCWSFQDRNLTLINGERMGHDIWNGTNCAVRVSYPYVSTKEFKFLKKIISKDKFI